MKNWPIWLFVFGVVCIVLFAFNYQGQEDMIPLSEIFPEEEAPVERIEYEFAGQDQGQISGESEETVAEPAVKAERLAAPAEESSAPDILQQAQAPAVEPPAAVKPDFSKVPYTIQVLSSQKKERVQEILKEIKDEGYPAHIAEVDLSDRGTWYRIYIGSFDTKAEADEYLAKVKEDYKNSFVISLQ